MSVDNSNPSSTYTTSKTSTFGVPDGRLGNYYDYAVTQVLERFLDSIRFSVLKSKYLELFKEGDNNITKHLRDVHKQLINQLRTTITEDIKILSSEANIFSYLKALDDLITKQKDRANEDAWRPSGNPENDIRDHIHHLKQEHKKCLEFVLETLIVENNKLEGTVEQNHAEILMLKGEIDKDKQELKSDFEAINAMDRVKMSEDLHTLFRRT